MATIEAEHYKQEVEELKKDPIIVAMAAEIPKEEEFKADFDGMMTANKEYIRRGGVKQRSIGGPAKAIMALREGK